MRIWYILMVVLVFVENQDESDERWVTTLREIPLSQVCVWPVLHSTRNCGR